MSWLGDIHKTLLVPNALLDADKYMYTPKLAHRRDYCYKAPDTGEVEENAEEVLDKAIGTIDPGQDLDPTADEVEAIADEKLAKLTDEHYYCQKVPCGVCEGDCNDSTQCSGDLVCIHREGNEPMDRLGCSGESLSS